MSVCRTHEEDFNVTNRPLNSPWADVHVEHTIAAAYVELVKNLQQQAAQNSLSETPGMQNRVIVVHGGDRPVCSESFQTDNWNIVLPSLLRVKEIKTTP